MDTKKNWIIRTRNEESSKYIRYISEAYDKDILIGEFVIEGLMGENNYSFNTGNTIDMSIYIEELYQGKGIAKKMILKLCKYIEKIVPFEIRSDQMLFIDADASNGFWNYIGMKDNRYYDRVTIQREGCGYEKVITWNILNTFGNR